MEITGIGSDISITRDLAKIYGLNTENPALLAEKTQGAADGSFGSVLESFMSVVNETNSYQLSAEKIQLDYAAGKTDDMLAVMLAQEKAYTSLNFTVQVTNKIIDAYREIMRMQM